MNTHRRSLLREFSRLLSYPVHDYHEAATALVEAVSVKYPDALDDLLPFQQYVAAHRHDELEEQFTRTFEINAQCALEVGWHLFGEEYLRGQLLVRMRDELRRHQLPETTELPDHITHVLALLAAMPQDAAATMTVACVLPALDKMLQAFAGKQNVYENLLRCLRLVLCREFDLPETCTLDIEDDNSNGHSDPLWSYPVQGQPVGGNVQFVPLELRYGDPVGSDIGIIAGGEPS